MGSETDSTIGVNRPCSFFICPGPLYRSRVPWDPSLRFGQVTVRHQFTVRPPFQCQTIHPEKGCKTTHIIIIPKKCEWTATHYLGSVSDPESGCNTTHIIIPKMCTWEWICYVTLTQLVAINNLESKKPCQVPASEKRERFWGWAFYRGLTSVVWVHLSEQLQCLLVCQSLVIVHTRWRKVCRNCLICLHTEAGLWKHTVEKI